VKLSIFLDDWVEEVWDSQFTECQDVDLEVSSATVLKALADVSHV
jgi:hypothetical protein